MKETGKPVERIIVYVHGQGGGPEEAEHYQPLFRDCRVVGFDYTSRTPWEAREEFPGFFDTLRGGNRPVTVIANSIGAFFVMSALSERQVEKAYFISPVVDMEGLIGKMMTWAGVSERELRERGVIETDFGEKLSWEYLSYVREHPLHWSVPTHILYGGRDDLTSLKTISGFAEKTGATLTVMEDGEHWFHTEEQMRFLDRWLQSF